MTHYPESDGGKSVAPRGKSARSGTHRTGRFYHYT
jgi:hypothetical protein